MPFIFTLVVFEKSWNVRAKKLSSADARDTALLIKPSILFVFWQSSLVNAKTSFLSVISSLKGNKRSLSLAILFFNAIQSDSERSVMATIAPAWYRAFTNWL